VRRLAGAIAALTIAGGTAALTAGPSVAATPSCGLSCVNVFSKNFGTHHSPQFVLDVFQQKQAVGQPLILFRTSNADPAEDFTIANEGHVSDFFAAGLVGPQVMIHYGCTLGFTFSNGQGSTITCGKGTVDDWAYELEYAPYGVDSGLCVGTATTALNGTKVSLQPCGASSKTVWISDTLDSCVNSNPLYTNEVPAINGSDINFSHPYVLTYPGGAYPTDKPRAQLFTQQLTGFSQTGNQISCGGGSIAGVNSNQLWTATFGVLP
jgi:hypothetical protein